LRQSRQQASIARRLTAVTANDPLAHPHTADKLRFDASSMIDPPNFCVIRST